MIASLSSDTIRVLRAPRGIERWREAPEAAQAVLDWARSQSGEIALTYSDALIINAAAEFLGTGRRLSEAAFTGNGQNIRCQTFSANAIKRVLERS